MNPATIGFQYKCMLVNYLQNDYLSELIDNISSKDERKGPYRLMLSEI